jgi:hypothetical protein
MDDESADDSFKHTLSKFGREILRYIIDMPAAGDELEQKFGGRPDFIATLNELVEAGYIKTSPLVRQ